MDTLESNITDPKTDLERQAAALGPWFHNVHLPDGTQTAPDHPLGDFPSYKWKLLAPHVPDDLSGWHVLDVGCNAGFYSIKLAERGAMITAVDADPHYLKQAAWTSRLYGVEERVNLEHLQVYELARRDASYDLILFLGVFYHLRYPLLALDVLSQKTERLLAFQSLSLPGAASNALPADLPFEKLEALREEHWPHMAFVEHRLVGDPTNWWIPNAAAVEAMLRSAGLCILQKPSEDVYLCAPNGPTGDAVHQPFQDQLRAATGTD